MKIENQGDAKETEVTAIKEPSTSTGTVILQVEEKRRRTWEQWSLDDIAGFFEGLNEFGKDFDAIQNYLCIRSRKKNVTHSINTKNKDQVRHFYYRTWHKISKYLQTPDEGKRMHKELYGLINYGEMWKKLGGFFNDRCGEKLNELVQHGATTVKIKGKSHRIKTPVCSALKRLQTPGIEPLKPTIPDRVVMELTPCCNADFLRVQSVAHNPRIRICSESQSPFANVIQFLTRKWKPRSILEAESIAEQELIMRITADIRQNPSASGTKKAHKRTLSGQEQIEEPELKLEPKSWTLETAENITVGEVYTICSGNDGRLPLTYSWERRSKLGDEVFDADGHDTETLLRALVSVAKSSLVKVNIVNECNKKSRRQIIPNVSVEDQMKSPSLEASPTLGPSLESPIQFSRTRQRLRRPLRYGTNLKRGSLAVTLNKMANNLPARQHSLSSLQTPATVSITWPSDEGSTGTAPVVLQVRYDGQPPSLDISPPPNTDAACSAPLSPDESLFRPPSILLHTPVKGSSNIGSICGSPLLSLPSTPNRLQAWKALLLPSTPEKTGAESSSVRSIPFSIPDSLSTYLGDNCTVPTVSSIHSGEGSTWPNRDGDEISLSSFLNQLVSPAKSTASSRYTDLKLPFDLQSLVADNSVDLTAKFAELAASIAAADATTTKTRP